MDTTESLVPDPFVGGPETPEQLENAEEGMIEDIEDIEETGETVNVDEGIPSPIIEQVTQMDDEYSKADKDQEVPGMGPNDRPYSTIETNAEYVSYILRAQRAPVLAEVPNNVFDSMTGIPITPGMVFVACTGPDHHLFTVGTMLRRYNNSTQTGNDVYMCTVCGNVIEPIVFEG